MISFTSLFYDNSNGLFFGIPTLLGYDFGVFFIFLNLTIEDIFHAIEIYIERIEKGDLEYVHYSWGDGDSLDRERVRDIILEQPQFSWSS